MIVQDIYERKKEKMQRNERKKWWKEKKERKKEKMKRNEREIESEVLWESETINTNDIFK